MARQKWREHWILDEKGRPKQVDLLTWARWFGTRARVLRQETIAQNWVSTVFMGIDHSFTEHGPPVLWETMTFGAKLDNELIRCAGSKEQAEAMHEEMVKRVCRASGIAYNPKRRRRNDRGVRKRLQERATRNIEKLNALAAKLLPPKRKRPPAR